MKGKKQKETPTTWVGLAQLCSLIGVKTSWLASQAEPSSGRMACVTKSMINIKQRAGVTLAKGARSAFSFSTVWPTLSALLGQLPRIS